jgi:hypothetical protein
MRERTLPSLSETISASKEPLKTAKSILLEQYRKTDGAGDIRVGVTANFEMVRSLVFQAVHECIGDPTLAWLGELALEQEVEEAREMAWYRQRDGIEFALRSAPKNGIDERILRMVYDLDRTVSDQRRFLGSVREYVQGVGYAISVRKRYGENQDSFVLGREGEWALLGIADGCGGGQFSSIASHSILEELKKRGGINKKDIISISDVLAESLNHHTIVTHLGKEALRSGTSSPEGGAIRERTIGRI